MQTFLLHTRPLFITISIALAVLCIQQYTFAQTNPELLLSWSAENYVPSFYQGKILPTQSTSVVVSVDMLQNNRVINISQQNIRWFVDDTLILTGRGASQATFAMSKIGGIQTVRAIVDYQGTPIEKTIDIQIKKPELVLVFPSPSKTITPQSYLFIGLPYFFNVTDLNELTFQWAVNSEKIGGSPTQPERFILALSNKGTPIRTTLNISGSVQSVFNPLELASKLINLIVQ
ncbi:MAG: hypothetical protein Q8R26_01415 [bacterium]|nr:hypothetical protein [bacterium]